MIAARGNAGSGATAPGATVKRGLIASAAVALAYVAMMAVPGLEPTPAAAQFSFGGFHIYIHGGGHYRGGRHYSRHRGNNRHARNRRGDETPVAEEKEAPSSSGSSRPAPTEVPVTPSSSRPALHGPDFEPSK
jgi:hypothetical protein